MYINNLGSFFSNPFKTITHAVEHPFSTVTHAINKTVSTISRVPITGHGLAVIAHTFHQLNPLNPHLLKNALHLAHRYGPRPITGKDLGKAWGFIHRYGPQTPVSPTQMKTALNNSQAYMPFGVGKSAMEQAYNVAQNYVDSSLKSSTMPLPTNVAIPTGVPIPKL